MRILPAIAMQKSQAFSSFSASLNLLKLHAIPKNFTNLKLFTIDFMSLIYQDLGDIHLYVYLYRPIRIVIHHDPSI